MLPVSLTKSINWILKTMHVLSVLQTHTHTIKIPLHVLRYGYTYAYVHFDTIITAHKTTTAWEL